MTFLKVALYCHAAIGATEHTRSYASSDLASFAVKNKGLKAGPGGRSSVGLYLRLRLHS